MLHRIARRPSLAVIALIAALPAAGSEVHPHGSASAHGGHPHTAPHGEHVPYAGMQARDIKALSEKQLADLRAGRGMSLALPAELNGYPGPAHVLELADELGLSPEQRERTRALFERMQGEAIAHGEALIVAERELDSLFREGRATAESVAAATSKAALAQGRLRESHLRYHLAMMEFLTPGQVGLYNRLRGY
jgi:Spy/CpxP family protein refolding chaperone